MYRLPKLARRSRSSTAGVLAAALIASSMTWLATHATPAAALQLIPSVGYTKSTDSNSGDAKAYGSLALRQPLAPFLDLEAGVAYREESYFADQLKLRAWPITASLWLRPISTLYAGAGVGYYPITFDYSERIPIKDSTEKRFGVHVGGGADIPLAPHLAIDLNGRYVMLRTEDSHLVPSTFNPDFWTASVGLAIGF